MIIRVDYLKVSTKTKTKMKRKTKNKKRKTKRNTPRTNKLIQQGYRTQDQHTKTNHVPMN